MKQHVFRSIGMAAMLVSTLAAQRIVANAQQKLPASCADRTAAGANIPGGWAFVLNFDTGGPEGCLITVNADGTRNFELVQCAVEGHVDFGAPQTGSALFHPGSQMLCEVDVRATEAADYARNRADYWMTASASFPEAGRFTLMRYNNNVSLTADMSPDGTLLLASAYGYDEFAFARAVGLNNPVFARSYVNALSGRHDLHYVPSLMIAEQEFTSSATRMKAVDFRNSGLLVIGSADSTAPMVLDELILDPTGRCCSGG